VSIKTKIRKAIKDFFQYEKEGDKKILKRALSHIRYENGYLIIRDEKIKMDREEDVIGVFLANIPYIVLGKGELHWDLPDKVIKIQNSALKLLECGINDVATLVIYLVMEMALRSLYSEYVKSGVIIQYKDKKIKVNNIDYRRLKLYIRRKGWSKYKVKVNGEVFPYSQGSLLSWAEKFMDDKLSFVFRLSVNVRNLLAHGEVEWNLFPTVRSLESASHASWLVFQKLKTYMKS